MENISRYVRLPEALHRSGLSRSSFYLMFARGELRRVKLGQRAVGIPSEEFDAWLRSRLDARVGGGK